jgi:hypothetical protein
MSHKEREGKTVQTAIGKVLADKLAADKIALRDAAYIAVCVGAQVGAERTRPHYSSNNE